MRRNRFLGIALSLTIVCTSFGSAAFADLESRPHATMHTQLASADTQEAFDGYKLYQAAYKDALLKHHIVLADKQSREKWAAEWEHKHDNDRMLDTEAGTDKAIEQMMYSLGQRFDHFHGRRAAAAEKESIQSSLIGIGAVLGFDPKAKQPSDTSETKSSSVHPIIIREVLDGAPASSAGLQSGDIILSVDGQAVTGLTLEEVTGRIRGSRDTNVSLRIERKDAQGHKQQLTLVITRAEIFVHPVHVKDLGHGITYITVDTFMSQYASSEFAEGLLQADQGDALVIDLRENGGGLLTAAETMAASMLPEGTVLAMQQRNGDGFDESVITLAPKCLITQTKDPGKPGHYSVNIQSRPPLLLLPNLPVVVLVDEGSYSASEILAGALQHNHRAVIVGMPTGGKGVGQSIVDLPYGRSMDVISFRFQPGGDDIDWVGVVPDIEIKQTDEPGKDAQLEQAKQVLRSALDRRQQLVKEREQLKKSHEDDFRKVLETRQKQQ